VAVLEVPDVLRHGQGARPGRPRLRDLPIIREEFGAGRLSYAKVRALTRIATPETEAGLAELAGPMTGNQLERFARAHRQASPATEAAARIRRRLVWRFDEDGCLSGTFRLPPLQGAVLLKALRSACANLAHPYDGVSADLSNTKTGYAVATSLSSYILGRYNFSNV